MLNDVVLNQVLVSLRRRRAHPAGDRGVQGDGTCWCGATVWQGRTAMRISVSSWATRGRGRRAQPGGDAAGRPNLEPEAEQKPDLILPYRGVLAGAPIGVPCFRLEMKATDFEIDTGSEGGVHAPVHRLSLSGLRSEDTGWCPV